MKHPIRSVYMLQTLALTWSVGALAADSTLLWVEKLHNRVTLGTLAGFLPPICMPPLLL